MKIKDSPKYGSIRTKILLRLAINVITLIFLVFGTFYFIISKSYLNIEKDQTIQNLQRASDGLDSLSTQLSSKLADWAFWDDTYDFVVTENKDYLESNLGNTSLATLTINGMVFVNNDKEIVFKKMIDLSDASEISSEALGEHVLAHESLLFHKDEKSLTQGVILLSGRPLFLSSRPILTSNATGPIQGTLIFVKYLDDKAVKLISDLTLLSVDIYSYDSLTLPEDVAKAKQEIASGITHFVNPLSSNRIAAYEVVKDIYGTPILLMRINTPRPIYEQSLITFYSFLTVMTVLIILFGILFAILIDKFVLKRLINLGNSVEKIGQTTDLGVRVEVGSRDEIGKLATNMNNMLEALAHSKSAILELMTGIESEKKNAEQKVVERTRELRDEKARLLASINSLSFGFIIADRNDNVILSNPAIREILDLKTEPKTIGDVARALLMTAKSLEVADPVASCKECMALKKVVEIKEIIYGKKYIRLFCAPVFSRDDSTKQDEANGYVFLVEDITEAKVVERSKEEFFAVASHELRTPLTAIRGNTEMILDMFESQIPNGDMKEMLKDIDLSSIRLIEMVNDFLEASRLEQGKVDMKLEAFDIGEMIEKTVRDMQSVSNERGLSLLYEPPVAPISKAYADRNRLTQVLVNLIGNGIKFTKHGVVKIQVFEEGDCIKVSVSDTGPGISLENQALLFRKFQQAGEKILVRDVTQSTGLGLYISKLLLSGMKGTIKLERSEVGKGSTFAFTVPKAA